MKVIESKKFLEDDDMVEVYKIVINHQYGLNAVLVDASIFIGYMPLGEFKKRYDRGDFPSDNGVCEFRYDVLPFHGFIGD